jgi:hypothetical protein
MGIFSRRNKEKDLDQPATSKEIHNSKQIHESFAVFVEEAKVVGFISGLNFESLGPHQKVFAFIQDSPRCQAFIVIHGDGVDLIQCGEGVPQVNGITYDQILEADILKDYKSDVLVSEGPDSDNSSVRYMRMPRAAMSLVTKEVNLVLIASEEQMEFVAGYLLVRRSLK